MKTAVAFIIFRRPELTAQVFEQIRMARPPRLYIIADGARTDRPGEAEAVFATRDIVSDQYIDWPCQVQRLYSEVNMGCKQRVSSGITAVFKQEEEAIILEDDCLPHPDFFRFCEENLEAYRSHSDKVCQISGLNILWNNVKISNSHYFSKYPISWGWATWRDRWQQWVGDIAYWKYAIHCLERPHVMADEFELQFWRSIIEKLNSPNSKLDSWAYPWIFTAFEKQWLSIVPQHNLISNLGMGENSTHTSYENLSLIPPVKGIAKISIPPSQIEAHRIADEWTFRIFYLYEEARSIPRLRNKLKILGGKYKQRLLNRLGIGT